MKAAPCLPPGGLTHTCVCCLVQLSARFRLLPPTVKNRTKEKKTTLVFILELSARCLLEGFTGQAACGSLGRRLQLASNPKRARVEEGFLLVFLKDAEVSASLQFLWFGGTAVYVTRRKMSLRYF